MDPDLDPDQVAVPPWLYAVMAAWCLLMAGLGTLTNTFGIGLFLADKMVSTESGK